MSDKNIRLIDEIYAELYNGEKPPYTNARGLEKVVDLGLLKYEEFKFKVVLDSNAFLVDKNYWFIPIVD